MRKFERSGKTSFKKTKHKPPLKCCCQSSNILKCICAIDKEIACFKDLLPHKHISRSTKEKLLFCLILRDLATLEKKIDKILCELTSDCNCVFDSDFDSPSSCDCDSPSHCDSDSHSDKPFKHCKL